MYNLCVEAVRNKLLLEKRSLKEASIELGCSIMTLSRFCKKHGITLLKRKRPIKLNLQGCQFGYLKVLEPINERSSCGSIIWKCQCKCGKQLDRPANVLVHGKNQSCGCYVKEARFRGVGDISACYLNTIRHGAISRSIEFDISLPYLWEKYLSQKKRCALSGVEIFFRKDYRRGGRLKQTASLDRIDSSKGYVEGNVQWVHKDINTMKSNLKDCQFIAWCRAVTQFSSHRCLNERIDLDSQLRMTKKTLRKRIKPAKNDSPKTNHT